MRVQDAPNLNATFLEEYRSVKAVRKYSTQTAGYGINYLLEHDYSRVYRDAIEARVSTSGAAPLGVLEFGCGAGMNLVRLVSLLRERQIPIARAYGTDFSETLIRSARREAAARLSDQDAGVSFHVARTEHLAEDLAVAAGVPLSDLLGRFDLVLGVNTFRYCHRLGTDRSCAADIHRLLRPGGICTIIDMNDRFPLFRSRLRRPAGDSKECYLPSLDEYAAPFEAAGLEILKKEHFCWIPHSAGAALTRLCRIAAPLLDLTARSLAMRSLVIARRPT